MLSQTGDVPASGNYTEDRIGRTHIDKTPLPPALFVVDILDHAAVGLPHDAARLLRPFFLGYFYFDDETPSQSQRLLNCS